MMTWMDLLQLLSEQPYVELQKEIELYSFDNDICIDYKIDGISMPTKFVDHNNHVRWDEWKELGEPMRIRLKPTELHDFGNGTED